MSDFKGIEVGDVLGLSEPLKKLVEVVSGAIGTCYNPINTVLNAKAKAKEIEILSSAINNNFNLPLKYDDGKVLIDSTSAKELIERTKNRLIFQEINKQQNIDSVVHNAYENLKEEDNVSKKPVDKDWILRFFNSIEDISNEEMQKIWGKVLAGEIKKPNTFSLRTLEILKNLTQEEAQSFAKISEFIMRYENAYFIPSADELLKKFSIFYGRILMLEECGLVNSSSNYLSDKKFYIKTNTLICCFESFKDINQEVGVYCYKITEAGKELLKIIEKKSNDVYAKDFFGQLKKEAKKCSVSVHKIKNVNNDTTEYEDEDLLVDIK